MDRVTRVFGGLPLQGQGPAHLVNEACPCIPDIAAAIADTAAANKVSVGGSNRIGNRK